MAGWALDQILVMLHPFMPFVTEELWHAQGELGGIDRSKYPLITAKWPDPRGSVSKEATDAIDWTIAFTSAARTARNELGIAPGQELRAVLASDLSPTAAQVFKGNGAAAITRLSKIGPFDSDAPEPKPAMEIAVGSDVVLVDLEGVIDVAEEKARLEKLLAASEKEAKSLDGRLSNANFVERAKPEAVEKAKADFAHHAGEIERLKAALTRLG